MAESMDMDVSMDVGMDVSTELIFVRAFVLPIMNFS